jgi:NADH:ubiquinone reductase (H+-translocating)
MRSLDKTGSSGGMAAETFSFPVVILGGGFAGTYCARALTAGLDDAAESVALVADQNAMLFHPMLAEVSGSSISPLHVVNPLRQFCRGSSIFMGSVEEVDLDAQIVRFSPGPYVRDAALKFEHLVLAIGSVVDVSRVPGMPEHGYLMKTVGDAIRLRADVIQRLEEASVSASESVRRRLLTFVVVGGGYSGVETAGQIQDLLRDVRKFYPLLDNKEFRLVLVHSGPYLLPQIGEELGRYCNEHLAKRGIEVRLNSMVTAVTAERAILNNGEEIETNTVITTVGNATHPVIKKLIDRYQLANSRGRLITEPTMQLKGHENLWSAGDCAAVPLTDGSVSPATAQFAIRQGTILGKNIIALKSKRPLQPFRFKALGEMACLGHLNAVGKVFGFKVSGLLGWLMWRAVYLSKLPGLERKLKVLIEWNLELLFPRDISLLDIKMTEVVGRVHLEKGDPVYHIGDPAFSFYLIEKGSVEISDQNGPVRALTKGHHFGERELLQKLKRQFNARALEPTTLLALDRATFDALAQNSLALGYLLNRSSVQYLTLDERKALVNQASAGIRQKRVADFMHGDPTVIHETDSVRSALKTFQQAAASMLPVVNEDQMCKGWLRLEFALDLLHQGKVGLESPVRELLIVPFIGVKADELVDQVLLRFAQTADRQFAVENDRGQLIGTLALLDLVLANEPINDPSAQKLVVR